jgi:uncharacterized protein YodC (DUF2158 family)
MHDEFPIGAIVQLRSGGSPMTVEGYHFDKDPPAVRCVWFDDDAKVCRASVPADCVRSVEIESHDGEDVN